MRTAPGGGRIDRVGIATESYLEHVVERFGTELNRLRIVVDCANGAYSGTAPKAFSRLGAEVSAIGDDPDGTNINVGCGATDLALLSRTVRERGADLGVAFDGDGDRMLAVDAAGEVVDGDQIVAILALHLGVELVAVTQMSNLGFHRLLADSGIRVVTTAVGDRYVLEALRAEGGVLGGEQSGHVIYLRDHVTGDGLAAALLLCAALDGRSLADAAAVMPRYPQVKENVARPSPLAAGRARRRRRQGQRGDGRKRSRPRPAVGHGARRPRARRGRGRGRSETPVRRDGLARPQPARLALLGRVLRGPPAPTRSGATRRLDADRDRRRRRPRPRSRSRPVCPSTDDGGRRARCASSAPSRSR